jgi:phosphotriesterase-related protein
MTTINAVLGPIDSAQIGVTLAHEHILSSNAGLPRDFPDFLEDDYMYHINEGLKTTKNAGIQTVVDATTLDLGRDIDVLAEASRCTGVNIIACTGWWTEKPRFITGASVDRLAKGFIRDIEIGISGTNIKAGILKGASDVAGVLPAEENILRAVARAHHRTGLPIMLHSYSPGQVGRRQIEILKEEGVPLHRVKLDHSNDTTDLEYLFWILDQGCFLGMDRYPGSVPSNNQRNKTLKALIDAGFAGRLCISHDWSLARHIASDSPIGTPERRASLNPQGYLYIKNVVFPELLAMGVSQSVIDRLLIDGPRNFFEGKI